MEKKEEKKKPSGSFSEVWEKRGQETDAANDFRKKIEMEITEARPGYAVGESVLKPWQTNNTLIIFLYLHLNLVFLLKRLIFQGFPTFEFSFLFKVSSQIFSYFLVFFPAILVNPLVKQASLPTGFFNYSLSDILLPLHHQNSHGCKCSRLH